MSKLYYLFTAVLAAGIMSCSSDDSGTQTTKPADYPTFGTQNFTSATPGENLIIKGNGFETTKITEYKVHVIGKPTTVTFDLKPSGTGEPIEAEIIGITPTELTVKLPSNTDNGQVTFTYKKFVTRLGILSL